MTAISCSYSCRYPVSSDATQRRERFIKQHCGKVPFVNHFHFDLLEIMQKLFGKSFVIENSRIAHNLDICTRIHRLVCLPPELNAGVVQILGIRFHHLFDVLTCPYLNVTPQGQGV
jgi:hypothetical protein